MPKQKRAEQQVRVGVGTTTIDVVVRVSDPDEARKAKLMAQLAGLVQTEVNKVLGVKVT